MKFLKNQRGFGLLELIVAIAILGAISATFLTASSTSYKAIAIANRESAAQRIAQLKMEAVKKPTAEGERNHFDPTGAAYTQTDVAYAEDGDVPHDNDYPGYTISVGVSLVQGVASMNDIQKITVTIKLNTSDIFTLVDYKVNR